MEKKLANLGVECGAFIAKLDEAKSEDYDENFPTDLFKMYNNCSNE